MHAKFHGSISSINVDIKIIFQNPLQLEKITHQRINELQKLCIIFVIRSLPNKHNEVNMTHEEVFFAAPLMHALDSTLGTVASRSSVTRRVLFEISIEAQIRIPTRKGFICG